MRYGHVRLPRAQSGRLVQVGCSRMLDSEDGTGFGWGATAVAVLAASQFSGWMLVGVDPEQPQWGYPLIVLGLLLAAWLALPLVAAVRGGFQVESSEYIYGGGGGEVFAPGLGWKDYRRLREPALIDAGRPVLRAMLRNAEAYAVGGDRAHAREAAARCSVLSELVAAQAQVDAARALTQAGPVLTDRDDVERAKAMLTALKEMS